MSKERFFYYVSRLGPTSFTVAKFDEDGDVGDQPLGLYQVEWDHKTGRGKCNCPAALYRSTGVNDKHIQMVKKWVENGDRLSNKKEP